MANLSKIDPQIWDKVFTYSNNKTKIDCLAWLFDCDAFPKVDEQNIHFYPFLNAVGLNTTYKTILSLSDLDCIKYISSVKKAAVYLNKVCPLVDCVTLFKSNQQGRGVRVAVIDTGCALHPDLALGKNRIIKFVDFVNDKKFAYDDNGHGTFVCGVVGGNGLLSNTKFHGIAPKCELVVLKALNSNGETQVFTILDAMQWVMDNKDKFDIKVCCMSFGSEPLNQNDPLKIGAEVLWDNGVVVVCASGNDGASLEGVKSPAISSKIISVGACQQKNSELSVAKFSSWGEFEGINRPDLVAPGVDVCSLNTSGFYTIMSGTSVSTPVVAGAVALILENKSLSPNQIKSLLLNSATPLQTEKEKSGAGLLNISKTLSLVAGYSSN